MNFLQNAPKVAMMLAIFLVPSVAEEFAQEPEKKQVQIEVCFVLDTTGSMGGLIQGAKDKIWSIANEMVRAKPNPNIQFGLVGYRDQGDDYVTQTTDLTSDLDAIHAKLMSFNANGGGDTPESVNQALHEAVTQMNWSEDENVLKIVFLVGDAKPHMDYDELQYPAICKLAVKKQLIINTIQCGSLDGTKEVWQEIASRSEGRYTAIEQTGGTVAIVTPFDDKIETINRQLNDTVICYGDAETQKDVEEKLSSNMASNSESIADRAVFYCENRGCGLKGKIIGGDHDLIEQLLNDKVTLENVEVKRLPTELQELDVAQRNSAIESKLNARNELVETMDELLAQRTTFIADKKKELAEAGEIDSFDENVKKMLREQGEAKGIQFDN